MPKYKITYEGQSYQVESDQDLSPDEQIQLAQQYLGGLKPSPSPKATPPPSPPPQLLQSLQANSAEGIAAKEAEDAKRNTWGLWKS